ncbi:MULTISPECIES: hypothetical protein [Phyllobacterium]|jgi:hypothetical protein|uniref:hypothetical protein n=1 Tax=Phyllobacterium TaxID=28100 RepID=UPI0013AFBF0F|nr:MULTISPECIES: hypothetical protein [Phyllobacterium]UXN64962.1 hypothetical protein N8E89_04160 [Phyllobacterium sp. A18/5-2]
MTRIAMLLAALLMILPGCTSSGNVSPLVFCDRPSDFGAKVFTNCTYRVNDY